MSNKLDKKKCRLCSSSTNQIVDLGLSPPANNFHDLQGQTSSTFPLVVDFCDNCKCIQLRDCLDMEFLYKHYSYLTPDIVTLTQHYEELIDYLVSSSYMNNQSKCLEIGSNKGLFLNTIKPHVSSILGVDPAVNIAEIANDLGVETICSFFDESVAKDIKVNKGKIDLVVARHMFAHNPDPKIILKGVKEVLSTEGIFLIENAYAIPTFNKGEFDQIYHEHMFYYSVQSMSFLLKEFSFELIDLFDSNVHGGSLVFIAANKEKAKISTRVKEYLNYEKTLFDQGNIFNQFKKKIKNLKEKILLEINNDIEDGKLIGAYGATAKSFTMFTYLGLNKDEIKYCVDTTPTKVNKYFPFFEIPVVSEDYFISNPVDTLLVTAWNYKQHIIKKSKKLFPKGTKLIFPLPEFKVHIV